MNIRNNKKPLGWEEVYELVSSVKGLQEIENWLNAKRGVAVWVSQDLSSAGRLMFTPGDAADSKPHWSMALVEVVYEPKRFKYILQQEAFSKPKEKGWTYDRRHGFWWKEAPWDGVRTSP